MPKPEESRWATIDHIAGTRALALSRATELADRLLLIDRKWHNRLAMLEARGEQEYHVRTDQILKDLSGATKIVSDMLAALSAYVTATADLSKGYPSK